jgi:aspartate carbamoyltransferase catalytic subunit
LAEGRQAALLFYENSTRTRMSFESALGRIGARALVLNESASSAAKGETLRDTGRNLEAMGIELVVLRHPDPDSSAFLASQLGIPVINGGAGAGEHPTQGLYDILTLEDALGGVEGRRVVIVGDIAHSRVARSNIFGLRTLGAQVILCGPPTLVSPLWRELGVEVTHQLEDALQGADAVMALRLQTERLGADTPGSPGEMRARYGLNMQTLARHPGLKIMHPGPIRRGFELSHDAADHASSLIMRQVANATFVRMAALLESLEAPSPAGRPARAEAHS